jgi:hypothetical protein
VYSGDAGLALLGKNLAISSTGELLSDFGGAEARLQRISTLLVENSDKFRTSSEFSKKRLNTTDC